ncbi:ABC transporter substrate-binding protein [Pseudomonas eucalypticola]|uniref:ABC transporter substrate-binding protein n=1 Tax=Pseudomonas eucalypticola TaxID=2599595 RepID=A0A7D5HYH5_9PSED|nr:ABC transporter substrate-binding protein [Pseudomonas eucalypticola]QKZ05691.1 ABC transporter substrate-binding protein [Pseudomonas eucalypticola]
MHVSLPLWPATAGLLLALACAAAQAAPALTLADQNEATQALLERWGETQSQPPALSYANFAGGPAILEAFRAGVIDVGIAGSTPPVQAQAAGEAVRIIAAVSHDRPAYQLAVRAGLEVPRLEALKGLKIAYAEGTARQTFVLAALRKAGLTPQDVHLVPLRVSDFPDALRSGQVDVAPLIEPHFSRYVGTGADHLARFVPEQHLQGLPSDINYLYASESALKDPAKRQALLQLRRAWIAANQWAQAHPDAWAQAYYVKRQQLDPADAQRIVESQGNLTVPTLAELIPTQQAVIDLIYAAGDLPAHLQARDEFDLEFAREAEQQEAVNAR